MATGWIDHPEFLNHDTGESHPERPQRLDAVQTRMEDSGLFNDLTKLYCEPCPAERIEAVHSTEHVQRIKAASAFAPMQIDADTIVSSASYNTAVLASGAVCDACDAVLRGDVENAFCAVRPPGHHAESSSAMGFCLFNHVAVAARYLTRNTAVQRVLVIDWDVHHGNGTQEIFYDDAAVFYTSMHQYPLYPGTGGEDERGESVGEGFTLNIPLREGSGDDIYIDAFEKQLMPAARKFKPDFILISAGFDAHRDDPLAGMQVTEDGFRRLTELAKELAADTAKGRLVSVLEGGYDLDALAVSVEYHVDALMS